MTTETTTVRFTRPYMGYRAGSVAEVPKGIARSLELFGRAVVVREPLLKFAAAPEPAAEVAEAPVATVARRGRRKKAT